MFRKTRYTVATLMLSVEGRLKSVYAALDDATRQIIAAEDEFEVAAEQVARICGALLEHEGAITHAASWGEVFEREEDAAAYGDEVFAECAGRYLSSGLEGPGEQEAGEPGNAATRAIEQRLQGSHTVVMLTIAYGGEDATIERPPTTRADVVGILTEMLALQRKDGLLLAHLHYAPGHPDEVITDEKLLLNYPELVEL